MLNYTPSQLSHHLWTHDPMGTCCNVNEDMVGEYDDVAATMVELSKTMTDDDAVKQAIVYWFDEYLYEYHKKRLIECLF